MDIILKQDVTTLGYKNDIVSVKPGYARNYLIPQGLAILATETNRKILAEEIRQQAHKAEKIKNEALEKAKVLEGLSLRLPAKAATTGKIFGSVNSIQLANAIKEACNIEVERKQIVLNEEAIKEVGNYTAKVKLHKEVQVEIPFEVFAEYSKILFIILRLLLNGAAFFEYENPCTISPLLRGCRRRGGVKRNIHSFKTPPKSPSKGGLLCNEPK